MKYSPNLTARGSILLFTLVVSAVIMTTTVSFFNYFASGVLSERHQFAAAQALALAEAGIDKAVYELNQDGNYAGENDTALGNGVFTVAISSIDSSTKQVTSTGFVPDSMNPTATKTVHVNININASVVSFRYGVQVGDGGVTMGHGSTIIGNLFSNGDVSGEGVITGDATVAVGTDVAADQQWTVQNGSFNVGDISSRAAVAQSFRPSVDASLTGIRLNLKKVGNPSNLSIKVVTSDEGEPSRTVLASGTIPASLVTTSAFGFVDVTLGSTPTLSAGHSYWIIATIPVSSHNYFVWGRDSNGGYSSGSAAYSGDWDDHHADWHTVTGDLDFMAFLSSVASSLSGVTVQGNAWASSLADCAIGGTASYQTISSCTVVGAQYPGTIPATPAPLPISDAQITDWETIALAGGVLSGPYSISSTETLGPKKIDGDLSVGNGDTLILSGPVWVRGDIILSNNAILLVSPDVGAQGAILIADATGDTAVKGKVNLSENVTIDGNGSENSFPMIISTNTGSRAVRIENNASSVILYAPYGSVNIENRGGASQITAKKLEIENNASVSYESGLQNASFSNGPGGSWTIVPGSYRITQ